MRHTRQLLVLIYALCLAFVMHAQTPVTSTEGYDFYATFLPNGNSERKAPDLMLQFLVSAREVPGHPEIKADTIGVQCGLGHNKEYYIPFDDPTKSTIKIDVPADIAYWDITKQSSMVETPLNYGVHIFSKNGVKTTVYAINQTGTDKSKLSMDGAHVLPKQALGHEYIVACNAEDKIASEFIIMSTVANTKVTIQLPEGVTTTAGNSGTLDATFKDPYNIYIVRSAASSDKQGNSDLSGTTICADQPVAVWSGNTAACFTTDEGSATSDHAFDQLLPINRWGTEFIVPLAGLKARLNELDIIAREEVTNVTITTSKGQRKKTLQPKKKWAELFDAYHGQGQNILTLQDSIVVVKADHPVQVYLYTSSAVYNLYYDKDGRIKYQGDPSMTMIAPLELLTDTAVFTTYHNPLSDQKGDDGKPICDTIEYELVVWAKKSTVSSIQLNGIGVNTNLFKNLPGSAFSNYQYARIPIAKTEVGKQLRLTAKEKGFGGYVCGLANGQACLYPIGYTFAPTADSLFLSKRYEPKEVHGGEFKKTYPDKGNGGGWYLDKIVLPKLPTQYDTIFICDSAKLRFPAIIHNNWDDIKWEVMRIDYSSKKRSAYEHEGAEYEYQTGDLKNPFLETRFFVLPEKDRAAGRRHAYEDFEVRAILYREPTFCHQGEANKDKWQKDTLSTIVRTYRSYNDTTWLIRCTNDTKDIVKKDDKYYIKFFKDPTATEAELTPIEVGENINNIPTHKYTTVNGCNNDSIVTLRVLLCESDVKDPVERFLCEDELDGIHSQLDGFFQNVDFYGTLQTCKKNKTGDGKWSWNSSQLRWDFTDTDVIRTTDCNSDMERWHNTYGAAYPRATVGCDRSLKVTLHVLPITEYNYSAVECKDSYTWSFTVNNDVKPTPATVVVSRAQYGYGPHDIPYPYTPGGRPSQGFDHQCQRELHTLHINFIRANETSPKLVEVCQDGDPIIVNKKSDPDIADETFEWVFTPKDSVPGTYFSDKIECANSDNCPYYMQYKIIVHKVAYIRDTVVYCYEDGSRIEHKWEGHTSFWGNIKGQPKTKKRYNANTPLRIDRPKADKTKDTRIIYELADTIPGNPCNVVYSQTVILLPPYSTSEKRTAISTEEWFEWHDVIWAGEQVNTATIPNPQGKPISVLQEYGRIVPEGWTVEYLKGDYLYALTTTTTVHQYKREDGSLTEPCDSTVQLLVQVADVQRERTYAWECSNHTPYEWKAGDTIIYVDLKEQYKDVSELPKTIYLEEHRKTVDDPKRTVSPWPVAGIDAYFYRDLTIYPAYEMTEDSSACQAPGETVVFKGISFSLDLADTLVSGNKLTTKPKYWTNPDPAPGVDPQVKVECDSIEGVRLFVHPIYTETVNKELSTYERKFYSHDTVTFFTNPKILFVGKDFMLTHPGIKDIEELKQIAQVDSAIVLDETLLPELGVEGSKGGTYHGSQVSSGTQGELSCDSTTFLDLTIFKANIIPAVDLGDNGDVLNGGTTDEWKFGGDTTVARADGTRYHTCPLMTGDYFHFYYDANGNIIGEVDYYDPDADPDDRRASRDAHYSENNDGTRTYLLIDTVLNADGTQDVYVQHVIVYPTYLVDANVSESLGTVEVCASDTYHWAGHRDVVVSELPLNNRQARVEDPMCAKRYANRGICVDSICLLELTVFGNANVPQKHQHCFNDSVWKWRNRDSIYYDADAPISGQIRDTIRPHDSDEHNCYDVYTLDVIFNPAYGVAPYKGYNNQYHYTYVEPYIYNDVVACYKETDFQWVRGGGDVQDPKKSNLYLYKYDGNKNDVPDNRYVDAAGDPTNKIPDNKVPTDIDFGFHTVRDSLLTVGCFCDSVLTLNYEIIEALPEQTIEQTICKGEEYIFGDTVLTTPGKYERYIQEEGKPCKTKTTLYLTVDEKATTINVDSALICFGEANIESTYALRYSYKGNHPNSYSVSYKEDAQAIGFEDIEDRPINERKWKADSVYVLNLPLPRLDTRESYPAPGVYHASISFKNEVCTGSSQMTYDFDMRVNYPAWVMEQRHGDLIVLLDANYNGGHAWTGFQWYKNGDKLFGYTKPYLYIPEGLLIGNEKTAEYHAVLTETDAMGEVISSEPTCPIVVEAGLPNSPTNPDKDHGPSSDYISVTPTCVPRGGGIHILSLNAYSSGEYRITTVDGQYISKGRYEGKSTPVTIPSYVEGMYIVQVWSSDKESKESYRAIKVIVKDTCPNCDKSSF